MKTWIRIMFIAATGIIVATYIANGAEKEDAWLYLTSLAVILIAFYDTYSRTKKNKD